MDDIRKMMDDEIQQELRDMYLQPPNTEGYSATTERLDKLYKLRIEERKAENEIEFKKIQHESEIEFKKIEIAESKLDRVIKIVLDTTAIAAPLIFYGVWMNRGIKFEQTGTFTSTTFRGLISRFRPTK